MFSILNLGATVIINTVNLCWFYPKTIVPTVRQVRNDAAVAAACAVSRRMACCAPPLWLTPPMFRGGDEAGMCLFRTAVHVWRQT
jgi:hypothetical protein